MPKSPKTKTEDSGYIPEGVSKALDGMSKDIFKSLLGDLSRKFKGEIERGIKEGLSSDQIGKNLQAKYGGFKSKITQSTIARTLLHSAYSKGAMFDTIDDPFIVAYKFYNPNDMRTSKICHHLAGKIIRKEDIAKYTPPLHWGCRSILIPVYDNDKIDSSKIVTPQMEKGKEFKKNVVDQIDPEFTNYMGVNKMLDEMKRSKDAQTVDIEATRAKTNVALEHLRVGMDTERLPGNHTGADDYVAKEVLGEIARREVPVNKKPNAKSYLDGEPELKGLHDVYKDKRIGATIEKKDVRKIIDATDRVGRDILKNEAARKFSEGANTDDMLEFFLEQNGGGILPDDLKKKIGDAIQRRAWDPMFLNPTLADLRRKAEAVVLRQGGDVRRMSEPDRTILNSYFDEFFRSVDRGSNVRITNPETLDAEILRIISQHPEYKNIIDRLYGHIQTFQETARDAVLRQLDGAVAGVTADQFEQNIIKNKIKLANFHVYMGDSLKTVNNIKEKIQSDLLKKQSGGIITVDEHHRQEATAAKLYEEFRKNKNDVSEISKNINWKPSAIKEIKEHIFFNKHELDEGVKRFDPDYQMALAWQRLIEGNERPLDILLLKHEYYEIMLMKRKGLNYSEAHSITTEKYNWQEEIRKELENDS